jgi:hypothetical protein
MPVLESQNPADKLKISPSIDERIVEQHQPRSVGGQAADPDPLVTALAGAVRVARDSAQSVVDLAKAAYQDASIPRAAAALQVRDSAIQRGTNVGKKFDSAISSVQQTIADIDKATAAPPAPREAADIALASEIRSSLKSMSREERKKAISAAFESDNMAVISAILNGPAFLTGMTDSDVELIHRAKYRKTKFPDQMARRERLAKALAAANTAGGAFVKLVKQASDTEFANKADRNKRAREALLEGDN